MAAFYETNVNLQAADGTEHLLSTMVTPEFFDVLGIHPILGAGFSSTGPEIVLSHGLWQRNRNVVGSTLRVDDKSFTVRGVMPADFQFGSRDVAAWITMTPDYLRLSRQAHFLSTVARLRGGVQLSQGRAQLEGVAASLAQSYPASNRGWGVNVVPLKEQLVGDVRHSLLVLMAAVGFVLLIACANIANLLLARGTQRQGEIAIRTALGASCARITRQTLTESVLLSLFGGAAGLLLSLGTLAALRAAHPAAIPRLDGVGVNGWVIAFALVAALLTGMVSGLAPALRVSRADLHEGLKEGGANRLSLAGHRLRAALIVSEVALSLLLLVGAGLLVRSFLHLTGVDPGFNANHVLTFNMDMPAARYSNSQQRSVLLQEVASRLRNVPVVDSVGLISNLPLTGGEGFNRFGFTLEDSENPATAENHRFYARWITPGYFASMGIPLLRGRDFTDGDRAGSAATVIIDAALARRYFPNENPIGKFLRVSYAKSVPREIVGVAGEVRLVALEQEPAPQIYVPVFQEAQLSSVSVVIRTAGDASAATEELRRIDRNLAIYDVRPMTERVAESVAPRRFNMLLMSLLAALALALAMLGVYGVISYMVGERRHEIGIRMSLGARPAGILLLVVQQGMQYVLIGIAIGLVASAFLTKALSKLLFGVGPLDLRTFAAVAILTSLAALLACAVPGFRASRVDPIRALRPR
jgi:putative ABC transport system permease protein